MATARVSNRAIWTGSITFGLVTIPVKLYTAVREENVSFHMLHDEDHARLRRKMVCSADGQEVTSEHTVKGYEIAPDQYVIITQEELDSVLPKKSKSIEIEDFVKIGEIDPVYFNTPYYVVPQETGTKPYRLLVDAMEKAGRVGIARFVLRSKESLCALRPKLGALIMETMYFGNEVVDLKEIEEIPHQTKTDDRELKMAEQLIGQLEADFDADKYEDEYVKALKEMVERKASGEQVVSAPEPEPAGRTTNLMEALQASLAKARKAAGREEPEVEDKASPEPRPARKTNPEDRPKKSPARTTHARKKSGKR
jgi:DNA end-binding protein Ku